MVDRERVLAKLAQLDGYLSELDALDPATRAEFAKSERKRACERLLQISIEAVLEVCHLFFRGEKLGLPRDEDDVLSRLGEVGIFSAELVRTIRGMKGFRNILVHEYGDVHEELVFDRLKTGREDFKRFRSEALAALNQRA